MKETSRGFGAEIGNFVGFLVGDSESQNKQNQKKN